MARLIPKRGHLVDSGGRGWKGLDLQVIERFGDMTIGAATQFRAEVSKRMTLMTAESEPKPQDSSSFEQKGVC